MPRHQRLAIVAAVACVLALLGVAAREAFPSRAVARHLVVQSAAAAPTTITAATIEVPVPVTKAPVAAAPTTVTSISPATTRPTTPRPATTAPPATAAPAPRPTTPPATQPAAARATGNLGLVVVAPPSSPSGSSADYTLIGYRWNPCKIITVSTSGPDAGTVGEIIVELSNLTGLHFMMVSSGGAITVAWGNVGSANEVAQTVWHSIGAWMTAANVTVDMVGTPYLPSVLRHELGHAMGLGHAGQSNEVMYPTVGLASPTDYGAGDRAGLRAVGTAAGGC